MSWFRKSKSKSGPKGQQFERHGVTTASSSGNKATLNEDRETLLAFRDTLAGTASMNWNSQIPIEEWEGVTVSSGRVTRLNLRGKKLTGTIPPSLGGLSALKSLVLEKNFLTGSIPPSMGNLSHLSDLWLKRNKLTGSIPPELGKLTNLRNFSAINNQLTGSIPATLGKLANLEELWLGNNQLSGEIPVSFGNLSKLRELWLRNNLLTGRIPEELSQLPNLQKLELGDNFFSDELPVDPSNADQLPHMDPEENERMAGHGTRSRRRKARRQKGKYDKEYSKKWKAGDAGATEFFVYILKLDGNAFYAGQTRELRERLMEHRDGDAVSTAGKNPRLIWFTKVSTRDEATTLESELKRLCDENPREVRRRVLQFQDLVQELDFT